MRGSGVRFPPSADLFPVVAGFGFGWFWFIGDGCGLKSLNVLPESVTLGGMKAIKGKVTGLYLKKSWYYYRPAQRQGVRPPAMALRTRDFAEAVRLVAEIQKRDHLEATREPMRDLAENWLVLKRRSGEHRSEATTRTARPALRRFFKDHAGSSASLIDAATIERWKGRMLADGLSTATIAGYMRYVQSFFSWLVERGQVAANPFDRVSFPKSIPTRRELVCTREQRDRLIRECPDPDLKAVLFFGFHAGLRRQEILNLRREWFIRDSRGIPTHVRVQNERSDGERVAFAVKDAEAKVIPLTERLALFLVLEYGTHRKPYLIAPQYRPGVHSYRWDWKRSWRTYMKSKGLPWVTPHVMRHTFVSLLLSADAAHRPSLLHIARWTGTSESVLMRTYAHLFDDPRLINAAS